MNISELGEHLKEIQNLYGNIEVVVDDADTGWLFRITFDDLNVVDYGSGKHLEIGPSYGSEIDSTEINKTLG